MRRLNTKEARSNLNAYQFEQLEKRGFVKEIYKDLTIWTGCEDSRYYLIIFRGTATNAICNYYYRNEQSRNESVLRYKKTADLRENYKAEQKNKTGFKTGAAACSFAIKNELKNVFPHIKFSVTAETFSMGDAVRIHWNDGPTSDEVDNVTDKYQQGHFDGMTDMYEYSNRNSDLPQSKYITTSRNQSEETDKKLIELLTPIYAVDTWNCYNIENLVYRLFCKTSFPKNGIVNGLEKTGETCGANDINVFYRIAFEGAEPEQEKELYNWDELLEPEKVDSDIEIIDYSEKAIAVIGNTKRIKDELKALGGRFNFRLSCGCGWVFPAAKREQILAII